MTKYYIIDNPPKDADGYNVVTDQEIATFEKAILNKAINFIGKYSNFPANNYRDSSIKLFGWNREDICQELRIAIWVALKNYNPEKLTTESGVCKKETYIFNCIKTRLLQLHESIWTSKRGFAQTHTYDSIILRGEFEKEL